MQVQRHRHPTFIVHIFHRDPDLLLHKEALTWKPPWSFLIEIPSFPNLHAQLLELYSPQTPRWTTRGSPITPGSAIPEQGSARSDLRNDFRLLMSAVLPFKFQNGLLYPHGERCLENLGLGSFAMADLGLETLGDEMRRF